MPRQKMDKARAKKKKTEKKTRCTEGARTAKYSHPRTRTRASRHEHGLQCLANVMRRRPELAPRPQARSRRTVCEVCRRVRAP